jgi:hypothetical protein
VGGGEGGWGVGSGAGRKRVVGGRVGGGVGGPGDS